MEPAEWVHALHTLNMLKNYTRTSFVAGTYNIDLTTMTWGVGALRYTPPGP
jgi:hypothetical protein